MTLDPTCATDPWLLAFSEDGRIYARYTDNSLLQKKAEISIEVLNLKDVRIEEARRRLWRECMELVKTGTQVFRQYINGSLTAKQRYEEICRKIYEMVSPYSEFSAMARYCFKGTGEDWVLNLL